MISRRHLLDYCELGDLVRTRRRHTRCRTRPPRFGSKIWLRLIRLRHRFGALVACTRNGVHMPNGDEGLRSHSKAPLP
eukprot:6185799-Pleurochrysis_carterae.AAC.1